MANHPETGRFPRIQKQIRAVPGIEAHHQAVVFQHAVHFMTGGLEPFGRVVPGQGTAGTVLIANQIRGIGKNKIDGSRRETGHHLHAVTQNITGHRHTPL